VRQQRSVGKRGRIRTGIHIRCLGRSEIHFVRGRIGAFVVLAAAGKETLHTGGSSVETDPGRGCEISKSVRTIPKTRFWVQEIQFRSRKSV